MSDIFSYFSVANDGSRYCKGGFYINSMAKAQRAYSPGKSAHSAASSGNMSMKMRRKR